MTLAKLAVLGNPIGHSRSPDIHGMFGEACSVELSYEKLLVEAGKFSEVAGRFLEQGIGLNVTVPCKHDAWQFVDHASDHAVQAQAVNTVSLGVDGLRLGHNTDGEGLLRDISSNLGWQVAGKRVLLLGAGGAVSGVMANLLAANPASVDLYNRTVSKAIGLSDRYPDTIKVVSQAEMGSDYDLIINGTSASLSGAGIALPAHIISATSCCYDMVYGKALTPFNRWCLAQAPCTVSDGLGMLVEQAALAFEIWFDIRPETDLVISALRKSL